MGIHKVSKGIHKYTRVDMGIHKVTKGIHKYTRVYTRYPRDTMHSSIPRH